MMTEIDIDISGQSSDDIRDFNSENFDVVISCCGCGAKLDTEELKAWKAEGKDFSDWCLDDPPAMDPGDFSEYRRVRDECKKLIQELVKKLT